MTLFTPNKKIEQICTFVCGCACVKLYVQVRTFKSAAGTMEATSCRVMTPALVLAPECEGKVPHNMSHSRTFFFFL